MINFKLNKSVNFAKELFIPEHKLHNSIKYTNAQIMQKH